MNSLFRKNPNQPLRKSFKMKTVNGFIVRYNRNGTYICFFVDELLNHRVWKLTIKRGDPLDQREYFRLKKEHNLAEQLLSPHEIVVLGRIASLVEADPFYGLTKQQRQAVGIKKHPQQKEVVVPQKTTIKKASKDLYEKNIPQGVDRFTHYLGVPANETVESRKEGPSLRVAYSTSTTNTENNSPFAEKLKSIQVG